MKSIRWSENNVELDEPTESSSVEVIGNHIYFYNGVETSSALKLNKCLQETCLKLTSIASQYGIDKPLLNLHINSGGGLINAGIAIMDTILRLKKDINIYTYVEGAVASSASFISCVGTKRFITKNSVMLIHQLSTGIWGKYSEIIDHQQNMNLMMDMIKRVYKENTRVPEEALDEILQRDIYWNAEKCLQMGLVDEII